MGRYNVTINDIEWPKAEVDECDWHCDSCGECLNEQEGFGYDCGTWTCTNCGCVNYINQDNINENTLPSSETMELYCDKDDIYNQISSWLYLKYGVSPDSFDYDIDDSDDSETDDNDDDFELANFCRGGDLTED